VEGIIESPRLVNSSQRVASTENKSLGMCEKRRLFGTRYILTSSRINSKDGRLCVIVEYPLVGGDEWGSRSWNFLSPCLSEPSTKVLHSCCRPVSVISPSGLNDSQEFASSKTFISSSASRSITLGVPCTQWMDNLRATLKHNSSRS